MVLRDYNRYSLLQGCKDDKDTRVSNGKSFAALLF